MSAALSCRFDLRCQILSREHESRLVPNPNVLLEYGYASRAMPLKMSVMNTRSVPKSENLPFDLVISAGRSHTICTKNGGSNEIRQYWSTQPDYRSVGD